MAEFTHSDITALIKSIPLGAPLSDPGLQTLSKFYGKEQKMARDIFLEQDRLDLWQHTRPHPDSTSALMWVRQNLEHALQRCPRLMAHWSGFSPEQAVLLVNEVGSAIDNDLTLTSQERLDILRGDASQKFPALNGLFRHALEQESEHFTFLSPAWLGADQSELRAEAVACGWTPEMVPRMCRFHADKDSANNWIGSWPFAYTLMLLDFHVHGPIIQEFSNECHRTGQWPVSVHAGASPRDVVVAQAILPYLDSSTRNYALTLPAGMAQPESLLPPGEAAKLVQLVDVYMGLGMAETLLNHFTRQSLMLVPDGKMLGIETMEGVALPEMVQTDNLGRDTHF